MRILFVCDGRSPIANNWISYFLEQGDEVHLASTFEVVPDPRFASATIIPVAFSQFKSSQAQKGSQESDQGFLWNSSLVSLRTALRRIIAPLSIRTAQRKLHALITKVQPDIIHAMRIPFEGIMAARTLDHTSENRLIVSVWGNDFTLHAGSTPWMRKATREVMLRADGLHTDCERDQELAKAWGFDDKKPRLVIPGNGGIDLQVFYPPPDSHKSREFTVINPRGIRAYIRNDTFFAAIPLILKEAPETKFTCPGMAGKLEAERWVDKLDLQSSVTLLPDIARDQMAELFRQASVAVSPSTHDGTPNTLLEAMACGCYPVAGDLDSIREWIEPGVNGSLIDPSNPDQLAKAVLGAIDQESLRLQAAKRNQLLIAEKAEYTSSMQKAREFYQLFLS